MIQARGWLQDPLRKGAALGVALIAWVSVQGDETLEGQVTATLAWSLPERLLPVAALPTQIQLKVKGTRNALRRAGRAPLRVDVDASGLRAGGHAIDLSTLAIENLPPGVEVSGWLPTTLEVALDEVQRRKVRVDVTTVGDPPEGLVISGVDVSPGHVELTGPRVVVSGMKSVATVPVDLSAWTASGDEVVTLDVPPTATSSPHQVTVQVSVEPRGTRRTLTGVAVEVRGNEGWVARPSVVDVVLEGPSPTLAAMDPVDVVAWVVLPDPPARDAYEAWFGEPTDGARLHILHPGGPEVTAAEVQPHRIAVARP